MGKGLAAKAVGLELGSPALTWKDWSSGMSITPALGGWRQVAYQSLLFIQSS